MALMNINIKGTPINLIKNANTSSNSCNSLVEFEVFSTSGASIEVNAVAKGTYGYDKLEVNHNGSWEEITASTFTFNLNSDGLANIRIIIGNVNREDAPCNGIDITLIDHSNPISDTEQRSEQETFSRCTLASRC